MDLDRIQTALAERFHQDGHRIVFWNDPDAEFASLLGELDLDGIALVRLDQEPALGVKVRVELENPSGRYLLYAPTPPPPPEQDWLLDMRLYGGAFSADRASMLLADLGLARHSPSRARCSWNATGRAGGSAREGRVRSYPASVAGAAFVGWNLGLATPRTAVGVNRGPPGHHGQTPPTLAMSPYSESISPIETCRIANGGISISNDPSLVLTVSRSASAASVPSASASSSRVQEKLAARLLSLKRGPAGATVRLFAERGGVIREISLQVPKPVSGGGGAGVDPVIDPALPARPGQGLRLSGHAQGGV